jgi:TonB family protein
MRYRLCVFELRLGWVVATKTNSAEILSMDEARARRRAADLGLDEFPTAADYLKTIREASGLTIEDVAERTRIKAAFISAIESMELDRLPSRPFAIGFVKTYAEEMRADAARVVAKFKGDAGFSAPMEIRAERIETPRHGESTERPLLSLFAVILVLGFIIWCAWIISRPRDVSKPFSLDRAPIAALPSASAASDAPGAGAPAVAIPEIIEARAVDASDPVYPRRCEAAAAEIETVELAFNVSASGAITGERVARSSNSCFNDAALNAARLWRFTPRTIEGVARTAYDLRQTLTFRRPE